MERNDWTRRRLLGATALGGGLWLAGCATASSGRTEAEPRSEGEVGPAEDLMREHGVLRRILLIYEESIRRLDAREDLPPETLASSAGIIRSFVEDYHEKLEENFLFPRFEKAGQQQELVAILRTQHDAGRKVTERVLHLSNAQAFRDDASRAQLTGELRNFIRMYRPHAAREDTVLFPAIRKIVSPNEYDALGEEFERKEQELFGQDGFEKVVAEVDQLERTLGIEDLAQFTPS